MVSLGVLVDPILPPTELVRLADQLEGWGVSSFWYPDEKFFRDCYVGLALVASHTRRIRLGPCVTDPYSRHPIQTAAAIGSLAEVAPGRVWLGIGAGGRGLKEIGLTPQRPAVAIREMITIIRGLLAGESVDFQGQVISLQNRPLDYRPPSDVKIMVGTGYGRQIQQLAGEMADAAMLANYTSPESIRKGVEWIAKGAAKAGRTLQDLFLISRVDVAVHPDRQVARAAVAPMILSNIRASYPNLNYLDDLPDFDMSTGLLRILDKKDYQTKSYYSVPSRCAPLIPPVLTDHLSISGTPDEVAARLNAIAGLGFIREVTVHLMAAGEQTLGDSLSFFHDAVIPQLQQFNLEDIQ